MPPVQISPRSQSLKPLQTIARLRALGSIYLDVVLSSTDQLGPMSHRASNNLVSTVTIRLSFDDSICILIPAKQNRENSSRRWCPANGPPTPLATKWGYFGFWKIWRKTRGGKTSAFLLPSNTLIRDLRAYVIGFCYVYTPFCFMYTPFCYMYIPPLS